MATGKSRGAPRKSGAGPAPAAGAGDAAPVQLLYGEDEYLVAESSRALVNRLCPPADQAFGLEIVEGRVDNAAEAVSAIRRCMEGVRTVGFLGGRKVVWLKDANFFSTSVTSEAQDTKAAAEQLVELIRAGLPPGQVLVISAGKVDRRSAFFKACQSAGHVQEFSVPDKDYLLDQHARETATAAFRKAGLIARGDVIDEFTDRTGADSRQIIQEVEKLSTYLGDRRDVTAQDVRAVVCATREAGVFDLAEAVGNRKVEGALGTLRQLMYQGENAVGLIIGLESLFRELIVFRECMDRRWLRLRRDGARVSAEWASSKEADAVLGAMPKDPRSMHWFRAAKLAGQAENFTSGELARLQAVVLKMHETMFSSSLPMEMLMEFLVLTLLGREAIRAANAER